MPAFIDLTGQRFGRWTVCEMTGKRNGKIIWLCKCDCGNTKIVQGSSITNGASRSCGCLTRETTIARNTTHGGRKSRLYNIWNHMLRRCGNPKVKAYKDYGLRGITVCPEWKDSFEAFRDWANANGYSDEKSIDRIDVNGNYCPNNCRWETRQVQNNNRRSVRQVTFNGITHTIREWSDLTGIDYFVIRSRLNRGWSVERALTEKPKKTTE